jgi:hypothetical protein
MAKEKKKTRLVVEIKEALTKIPGSFPLISYYGGMYGSRND